MSGKRIYEGKYFDINQNGEEFPFCFKMTVELDDNLNFTGTVWEEEFSVHSGKDALVKGFIDADHISFVMKYPCHYDYDENDNVVIDETKVGHEVIYEGNWEESAGKWTREWEVEGDTTLRFDHIKTRVFIGAFEMKMMK